MGDQSRQNGHATGRGGAVARAITEVFAPQYVAVAMPPVTGAAGLGGPGLAWGLLAAAMCAGVPAAVIAAGVRRGRLDSIHLVERASRRGPMLVGLVAVVVGLAVLVLAGAPRLVLAGTAVVLAHVLPPVPVAVCGTALVVVIAWARTRVSHHTAAQTVAGAVTGGATAAATLAVLL
ncbi:hypothetical protein [Nonomuraea sp. NPDC005692]|uniref:hypothetical protein n=1 Tax=Nonomuraea sp. NPDC005692 TaxID=3157168 RepID=UPI00340D8A75